MNRNAATGSGAGEGAGPQRVPAPDLSCSCAGCVRHVARLEEMNRVLSAEIDRLRREGGERRRAA